MGKSRIGISHLFTSQKLDSKLGRVKQPLVISSPIGPVKNSRGPDFTRSDGLIIVDGIKDYGPTQDNDAIRNLEASLSEKKMAMSMFARKTLLKTQSLASLSSKARDNTQTSATTPRSKFDDPVSSSVSKLKSASISTTTVFTDTGEEEYTHKSKPPESAGPQRSKIHLTTRLPKSKTMNVLQDIKNSVPRRANLPASVPELETKKLDSAIKQPDMSRVVVLRSLRRRSQGESASSSRHSSTTNITTPDSSGQMNDAMESNPRTGEIVHAQTSAYWTGRFTTLRDRLCDEHMAQVLSKVSDTVQFGTFENLDQTSKTENSELSGNPPYPLRNEDDLCRQVFIMLESQCMTRTSKESLRLWRENFARIHCRPDLLPKRFGFFGDSRISKRFASQARHQDVQSLAFLEDAYYSNASNAFGMTNPHSVEGRYLNFR
ncbi:hypothetical protein IF2G_03424 [Cordyceps javanica]|nr:hypothetical protein IF2G_03424 [Cordyceps javanica]